MTIEKAISHLGTYSSTLGSGQTPQEQHEESKRVAISTMRKFQKIEQILDRVIDDGTCMYDTLEEIREVVEDGNE
jgi:hypothetical protein